MVSRYGWLLLGSLGCGPVISGDDTGDGSVDGTGTGTGTMTTATTASTSTTAGTTAATTSTTTTGEPTGCAENYVTGCQSYCAAEITCNPELGTYEDCVNELCSAELAAASAECQQIFCEAFTCYGVLDCATLENGSPECEAMAEKADAVCEGGSSGCSIFARGGACEYTCGGDVERRLVCEAGSCVCYEDDVQVTECPIDGVCDSSDTIVAYATTCCGW